MYPIVVPSTAVSSETAYVVKNWPYGFRLRCEMRFWIETRPGFGQRVCQQTTNPKRNNTLNKPKAGGYHAFALVVMQDAETTIFPGLSLYSGPADFAKMRTLYGSLMDEAQLKRLNDFEAACRKLNSKEWAANDATLASPPTA